MFELNKTVTKPNYQLNYKKPCLTTALMRSPTEKTTRKNNKQQDELIQKFHGRNPIPKYLNLKAPNKNVKKQSDLTLTAKF